MNIDKSVTVRGSFQVDGDLVIEGRLEGSVFVTGRLDIGPDGVLVGEATCCGGALRGKLSGILRSDEPVEIDPRAVVAGRVMAPALDFGGSVQSYERPAPERIEPAPRPRQSAARPAEEPRPAPTKPASAVARSTASRIPTVTGDRSQVLVNPDAVLAGRP